VLAIHPTRRTSFSARSNEGTCFGVCLSSPPRSFDYNSTDAGLFYR
jgi:hypothetical protein